MLAKAQNAEFYPEWLGHIQVEEARDAFCYIVGRAATLRFFVCHPQHKGVVRDFRFIDAQDEQPFAFIPNKSWLLFYFRAPAIRSGRYSFDDLRAVLDSASQNNSGEWTVKLRDLADAQRLWRFLALE